MRFRHDDGTTSPGFIDLYKQDSFVLEAKQSKKRQQGGETWEQLAFALDGGGALRTRPKAKSAAPTATWDVFMRAARRQAQGYARALEEWPPFLVIVDVGHSIELWSDFQRQGKDYVQFPNRNEFRIRVEDLRRPEIRERLKAVCENPLSLDPARASAEVTQSIAALLAEMTKSMERRAPSQQPEQRAEWAYKVSKFLMRCIFAMFADSIGLLPRGSFGKLIASYKGNAGKFHFMADQFFREMDTGAKFSPLIQAQVKRFNGGLFHDAMTVEISEDELMFLEKAAGRDWQNVEPAIFGTLLEQALSVKDRAKLGAHYTPRAYVERLIVPTIIEPLNEDWDAVQSEAIGKALANDYAAARQVVRRFHDKLCDTRVLDPACGTGNFLYVALELMKRLEGEVLDFLRELGDPQEPLRTVDPHQFYGIEKNPRAAPIAELVLWIGYIQWWFRTRQRQVIEEPILRDFQTIKVADAVLAWDRAELLKGADGKLITRQDPDAVKLHPITGEAVPDPDARLPVFRYVNPRVPKWPVADFIVGNPPFIGGKDIRAELGDGYVEALWKSRGKKSDSIDFVMYWWDMAAEALRREKSPLRCFGFITTNSITQKFSRRVIEKHLTAKPPLSLIYAVPDHPWMKQSGKAAVRIAMTVAARGSRDGALAEVIAESGLETDAPVVELSPRTGAILSDLTIGIDVTSLKHMTSNSDIAHMGVKLHGNGFIMSSTEAVSAIRTNAILSRYIRPFVNGRDLADRPRDVFVIDLFGLAEQDVRREYPSIFQRLFELVKPERDTNNREIYRRLWWIFGEPRKELRPALNGLIRYIATTRTSKHRLFQFLDSSFVAESKVVVIAAAEASYLGVLCSRHHEIFATRTGGWLGVGNDPTYNHSDCFDPFPFPAATDAQKSAIRALAEELDALRKRVIAETSFLTMTRLYNVRERLKEIEAGRGAPLDESERAIHDKGCVSVIHELHRKIDAAVADAYGWPADLAEEEILARLVALNKERADEEAKGLVRWLRPEYQIPRARVARGKGGGPEQIEAELPAPDAVAPALPEDDAALIAAVRTALRTLNRPAEPIEVARRFAQGGRGARRVERGLQLLAAAGVVRRSEKGWFIPASGVN